MNIKKVIIIVFGVLITVFLAVDVMIFVQGRKSVARVSVEEKKPVDQVEGESFEIDDTMDSFAVSRNSEGTTEEPDSTFSGGEEGEGTAAAEAPTGEAAGEAPTGEAVGEVPTGEAADEAPQEKAADEGDSEYIFPDSASKRLKKADLKGMSKKELKLARNELYARHGYIFKDKSLAKYFEGKSWYRGTIKGEDFKDNETFNDIEIANRNLILKYEKKGR